ncbi:DUF2254 domain-containing protein [Flavobacterium rhizosphaerae]|uniref:DUF2254 domain-containing protein n=1 Tax=Flavobacterium rhizosphaerae TaxID=3163298 RepID=A0ABW8YWR2_9FLAO
MGDVLGRIKFWIRNNYNRIVNSIAFYPAFISLVFLIISVLLIEFDFSETGKHLKSQLTWLSLQDASTARNIIGVVAAGILSLTVFSFSMVMIVLNQAASQMSNRVLNKLIGNRFQQVVLGIYIGTIVFALFLLSTIRDINSGIYVPAISTYILIFLAIVDIFIFIYFLHYITQSVKYEVIIDRIYSVTLLALKDICQAEREPVAISGKGFEYKIKAPTAGVYEGVEHKALLKLCKEHDFKIFIKVIPGTFVLEGTPILEININPDETLVNKIQETLYLHDDETISNNFLYGFRQLTEISIKALSPGINDPGTAALALRALFKLFAYRFCFFPENILRDDKGISYIYITYPDFDTIFKTSILPIWDYGHKDRIIQNEMHILLTQFLALNKNEKLQEFLQKVNEVRNNNTD